MRAMRALIYLRCDLHFIAPRGRYPDTIRTSPVYSSSTRFLGGRRSRLGLLAFAGGGRSRRRWITCCLPTACCHCYGQRLVVENQQVPAGTPAAEPLPELVQPFVGGEGYLSVEAHEDVVLVGVAELGLKELLQPPDGHRARAAQKLSNEPQGLLAIRVEDQAKLKVFLVPFDLLLPNRTGLPAQVRRATRPTRLFLHGGSFLDGLGKRPGIVLIDDAVDHLVLRFLELLHVGIYLANKLVKRRVLPQIPSRRTARPARWAFFTPHAQ
mmetsp:Transcript_24464/g.45766  ORF Transcript_24464/g.45766 Transcript_24464/m.45766 type:complete len:268 (+) Transcript_24464:41-844(+)